MKYEAAGAPEYIPEQTASTADGRWRARVTLEFWPLIGLQLQVAGRCLHYSTMYRVHRATIYVISTWLWHIGLSKFFCLLYCPPSARKDNGLSMTAHRSCVKQCNASPSPLITHWLMLACYGLRLNPTSQLK